MFRLLPYVMLTGNNNHVDNPINHLSLCTGYAGIDLGLRTILPKCRTVVAVEIEAFAIANLVSKMEAGLLDSCPIFTDLHKFDGRPFCGLVDILSGGFPCQPFSVAGRRESTEDPRHLFPSIERIIRECRPSIVFLENVEGIISSKFKGEPDTSVLKYVLERLEEMGYVATAGIFSAEEVGLPHRRKRVFILGVDHAFRMDSRGNGREVQGETTEVGSEVARPSELGNTEHDGPPSAEERRGNTENGDRSTQGSDSTEQLAGASRPSQQRDIREGELAHTKGGTAGQSQAGNRREGSVGGGEEGELEHATSERLEGCGRSESEEECEQRPTRPNRKSPSRPSEAQQPWEFPRTIGETEETITAMGGSTHGTTDGNMVRSCRIDSLRLLGNGVVPDCAAKAFATLMGRLMQ